MPTYQIKTFKKHIDFHSETMNGLFVVFWVFILFFTIQYSGNACLAKTDKAQEHGFCLPGQKFYRPHQALTISSAGMMTQGRKDLTSEGENIVLAVAIIENRFIAWGIITDIKPASKGIQKFTMQIKKIEPYEDYPNFGSNYLGKEVDIFSEIAIPSSFQVGTEVSVMLRVSGDEWGQYLFMVEVIENGTKN